MSNDISTTHGDFCNHYRAMSDNKTCKLDIDYMSVRANAHDVKRFDFPCFNPAIKSCAHAVYPTTEELEAYKAKIRERLMKFEDDLDSNICPHCQKAIEQKRQIGRCVYAFPCGCRLYQGRLK